MNGKYRKTDSLGGVILVNTTKVFSVSSVIFQNDELMGKNKVKLCLNSQGSFISGNSEDTETSKMLHIYM